jgi:hypothetical protein
MSQIARFADPHDDGLHEAIEPAEQLLRGDLDKIPGADRMLHRLQHRILADALTAAEYDAVIDLLVRPLHPMREPLNDPIGLIRVDQSHVIDPPGSQLGITRLERRGLV